MRGGACPECSAPITLGVRSPGAVAGPWALGLIAFALGLGFDAVTGLFLLIPLIGTGGEDPIAVALWVTMATLAVGSALGLAWMLWRRRVWMRMPVAKQWRYAWVIFFGVGVFHACAGGALIAMLFLV